MELTHTPAIYGLKYSFKSLKHLKLLNMGTYEDDEMVTDYSLFENLKILSLTTTALTAYKTSRFPKPLEATKMVWYLIFEELTKDPKYDWEEDQLSMLLERKNEFLHLRVVIVPSRPIAHNNKGPPPTFAYRYNGLWKWKGDESIEHEMFKKGKVKLKLLKETETGEFSSKLVFHLASISHFLTLIFLHSHLSSVEDAPSTVGWIHSFSP